MHLSMHRDVKEAQGVTNLGMVLFGYLFSGVIPWAHFFPCFSRSTFPIILGMHSIDSEFDLESFGGMNEKISEKICFILINYIYLIIYLSNHVLETAKTKCGRYRRYRR
jgi:hypothetical protein